MMAGRQGYHAMWMEFGDVVHAETWRENHWLNVERVVGGA
jgi:translation initiation factor IF-1